MEKTLNNYGHVIAKRAGTLLIVLFKENHENNKSIDENIEAAKALCRNDQWLIGVEGYDFDAIGHIRLDTQIGASIKFAQALKSSGSRVYGIDSRRLSDQILEDIVDEIFTGKIADHKNQHERSRQFLINTCELIKKLDNCKALICCGARHVEDIANLLETEKIYSNYGYMIFQSTSYEMS